MLHTSECITTILMQLTIWLLPRLQTATELRHHLCVASHVAPGDEELPEHHGIGDAFQPRSPAHAQLGVIWVVRVSEITAYFLEAELFDDNHRTEQWLSRKANPGATAIASRDDGKGAC